MSLRVVIVMQAPKASHETQPWIQGNLRITPEALAQAEQHALRCYPSECCGFMSGPADPVELLDATREEENEADKYHKLDPVCFPRDSRTYFKMNELRAMRAFAEGEAEGRPIKVIYHSHCDAGPYFSEEDAATFASDGQLMWPCAFLVISVKEGKLDGHKLWIHRPGSNAFDASPIETLSL